MQNNFFKLFTTLQPKIANRLNHPSIKLSALKQSAAFAQALRFLHTGIAVFKSPAFQAAALVLIVVLILAVPGFAQDSGGLGISGGNTIDKTLQELLKEFYNKIRLPLVGVFLFYAIVVAVTDNQNGVGRAIKTVVLAAILALIPSIVKFIGTVTGTAVGS